jgi:hypothetical protein
MAMHLSQAEIGELRVRAERLAARAKTMTAKAEAAVEHLVQSVEIGGAAFALGIINGRFDAPEPMGVPLDLGTGVALHLLGFLGVGGKFTEHLHNFADGALASYLVTLGFSVGGKMRTSAGLPAAAAPGALPGATAGQGLTDAELANLARGRM